MQIRPHPSEWSAMHPTIAAALIIVRHHTCPCGAYTNEPYGFCTKCRARQAWRHRHRSHSPRRRVSRRPSRRAARFLPLSLLISTRQTSSRPSNAPGGDD